MGFEYSKRAVGRSGSVAVPVTSVTLSTALQTLGAGFNAVTYDTSGNPSDALIPAPTQVGEVVRVALFNDTTSVEANFNTAATGSKFFGTTANTITSAATATLNAGFELTALSTSQWAVTALSATSHFTFTSTTGSTGQS